MKRVRATKVIQEIKARILELKTINSSLEKGVFVS